MSEFEKFYAPLALNQDLTYAEAEALMAFLMGGTEHKNEKPIHRVTLTAGFFLGVYPITQGQWKAVMGTETSHFQGLNRPV